MKRFASTLALVAALAAPAAAQETVLRVHQFLPATETVPAEVLEPWAARIEEQSGGRLRFEFYPLMQLGGTPPQLFDQAREGVADIVWTVLGYTPGRFPKSEAFELPFTVTTGEATSRAFQDYVETHAMDEFADVHLLAVHTHGPGLFHSRAPIASLEDLGGLKVRGGSRVINDMLADLGAAPIGMPVPEVPQSLLSGVIDAATIPWQVTISLRSSEIVRHHTAFSGDHGLYTQTFGIVMNRAVYEGLPEDLRAIIDANSGMELAAAAGRANDEADIAGRDIAVERGNEIVVLDEAETARWREAAEATIARWIAEREAEGIDGAALHAAAVALVERYSGE